MFCEIWIVSPTAHLQPIFKTLDPNGIKFINGELTAQVLSKITAEKKKDLQKHVLVVLDDCGRVPSTHQLEQLVFLSRHMNCAIVMLVQKLTSCPTSLRSQADVLVSFATLSQREKQAFYKEAGRGTFQQFSEEFETATNRPFGTLTVSMQHGRPRYFQNVH